MACNSSRVMRPSALPEIRDASAAAFFLSPHLFDVHVHQTAVKFAHASRARIRARLLLEKVHQVVTISSAQLGS